MDLTQENLDKFSNEIKSMTKSLEDSVKTHGTDIDKVRGEMEAFKTQAAALKASVDGLETKSNAPPAQSAEVSEKEAKAALDREWKKFLHTGDKKFIGHLTEEDKAVATLSPIGKKMLATDSDPAGGYLIPQNKLREMITLEVDYCPMMELARVLTISEGDSLSIPKKGTTSMAVAVAGERETRSATTSPTVEQVNIHTFNYEANPLATNQMVSDSMFPLETWLADEWAEQSMYTFAADVVSGTGAGKPTGFTAETVQSCLSGASGALAIATLPKLMTTVKKGYRRNGKWAANGATIATVYGLALTTGYQPFVGFNPTSGEFTFGGKEAIEFPELPDIGSSAYPIYFGDWSRACWIVKRADVELIRNPYLTMGFTYFYYKVRLGFKLVNAAAIAKMKSHTS